MRKVSSTDPNILSTSTAPTTPERPTQIPGAPGRTPKLNSSPGAQPDQVQSASSNLPGVNPTYKSNKELRREVMADGTPVVRMDRHLFVERQADGSWKTVAPGHRTVSKQELEKSFGLWNDEEVTSGHLFLKKVVRPRNGRIESDEVITMAKVMSDKYDYAVYPQNDDNHVCDRLAARNVELTLTPNGGTLHTDWEIMARRTRVWKPWTQWCAAAEGGFMNYARFLVDDQWGSKNWTRNPF